MTSGNDLTIESSDGALKLSGKAVAITSTADAITLVSKAAVEIEATGDLKQRGNGVEVRANGKMDLKAGPQLNIKGGMVNIN